MAGAIRKRFAGSDRESDEHQCNQAEVGSETNSPFSLTAVGPEQVCPSWAFSGHSAIKDLILTMDNRQYLREDCIAQLAECLPGTFKTLGRINWPW